MSVYRRKLRRSRPAHKISSAAKDRRDLSLSINDKSDSTRHKAKELFLDLESLLRRVILVIGKQAELEVLLLLEFRVFLGAVLADADHCACAFLEEIFIAIAELADLLQETKWNIC